MKKTLAIVLLSLAFFGCSSKSDDSITIEPKLVVGKSLKNLTLSDQHEKPHTLAPETTKLIFALNKESAHICNDFFVTQSPEYLQEHQTQFIADVSAAPSLIRSMFIMPGLKEFKHTVLVLDDEEKAAAFRSGVETEKILLVKVQNATISSIETLSTEAQLKAAIETK